MLFIFKTVGSNQSRIEG